jgi:hypothetical protein
MMEDVGVGSVVVVVASAASRLFLTAAESAIT